MNLFQGDVARRQYVLVERIRQSAGPSRVERFSGAAFAQRSVKVIE
jgi:hypothetical protein